MLVAAYQIEHSDAVPASPNLVPPSRPPSTTNLRDATLPLPPPPSQSQDTKRRIVLEELVNMR